MTAVMEPTGSSTSLEISMRVNGEQFSAPCEARRSLADFVRRTCGLTGTHLGCEHGVCGACTVQVDGVSVRSCLMLAVQARGCEVTTVEGLAQGDQLHPLQESFWDHHGLQCGFCTPGILMAAEELLRECPDPTDDDIRARLSANLCRCTGYQFIIDSVRDAAARLRTAT